MLFPTVAFAIFFVVVLGLNWLLRPYFTAWRLFLIAASYFFYGYWEVRFLLLVAGMTAANWALGKVASRVRAAEGGEGGPEGVRGRWSRVVVAVAVAFNLGVLAWFKYYGFFVTEFSNAMDDAGMGISPPLLQVTLPLGISFMTFQAISYVVDVARGKTGPMGTIDFALFVSFFPHIVAGPIVRATEFGPQIRRVARRPAVPATAAFVLIVGGLFKKVVISSYLGEEIVDPVFGVPGQHSGLEVLLAAYGYAIQIFADFSGYTDIAIGCALLLGFQLPQNFDQPYRAVTLQGFWRRWHMSLSRWLRDYLYIPLGGSRHGEAQTARNTMVTFVLGGLWHGAAWTFVIWGAIHGLWLTVERLIGWQKEGEEPGLARLAVRWLVTFHVVCLGWVFFRAESLDNAMEVLGRLTADWTSTALITPLIVLVIGGALAAQFIPAAVVQRGQRGFARMPLATQVAALAICLVGIDALGPEGVSPFIYYQF